MKHLKYYADVDSDRMNTFREAVISWYTTNGRDLPWRRTTDPYAILVSEIMLHQTTVQTVYPVYQHFMAVFPTIEALQQATLSDVKEITDPLGYKVRGSWLHNIAQTVVLDWGGKWPREVEELMKLPGVGRYTAGAIVSFAFGVDAPILDTNVKRILGRYFGVPYRHTTAESEHHLWALAEAVIPTGQAILFNQALMDFGAMLCTSRRPLCTICPAFHQCMSASGGVEHLVASEEPLAYRITPRVE